MNLKKGLFFGIVSLSVIFSTTGSEQFKEENFESFRNRGLQNFLDGFGKEIYTKLTEAPIEKEQAAEIIKKIEPEVQQAKIIKTVQGDNVASMGPKQQKIKQKTEQRENKGKICLLNSGIDIILEHVKVLCNYELTYRVLLNTLETMKIYYNQQAQTEHSHSYTTCLRRLDKAISQTTWKVNTDTRALSRFNSPHTDSDYCCEFIYEELKGVIKMKMENYKELQGTGHPRWDEFTKM